MTERTGKRRGSASESAQEMAALAADQAARAEAKQREVDGMGPSKHAVDSSSELLAAEVTSKPIDAKRAKLDAIAEIISGAGDVVRVADIVASYTQKTGKEMTARQMVSFLDNKRNALGIPDDVTITRRGKLRFGRPSASDVVSAPDLADDQPVSDPIEPTVEPVDVLMAPDADGSQIISMETAKVVLQDPPDISMSDTAVQSASSVVETGKSRTVEQLVADATAGGAVDVEAIQRYITDNGGDVSDPATAKAILAARPASASAPDPDASSVASASDTASPATQARADVKARLKAKLASRQSVGNTASSQDTGGDGSSAASTSPDGGSDGGGVQNPVLKRPKRPNARAQRPNDGTSGSRQKRKRAPKAGDMPTVDTGGSVARTSDGKTVDTLTAPPIDTKTPGGVSNSDRGNKPDSGEPTPTPEPPKPSMRDLSDLISDRFGGPRSRLREQRLAREAAVRARAEAVAGAETKTEDPASTELAEVPTLYTRGAYERAFALVKLEASGKGITPSELRVLRRELKADNMREEISTATVSDAERRIEHAMVDRVASLIDAYEKASAKGQTEGYSTDAIAEVYLQFTTELRGTLEAMDEHEQARAAILGDTDMLERARDRRAYEANRARDIVARAASRGLTAGSNILSRLGKRASNLGRRALATVSVSVIENQLSSYQDELKRIQLDDAYAGARFEGDDLVEWYETMPGNYEANKLKVLEMRERELELQALVGDLTDAVGEANERRELLGRELAVARFAELRAQVKERNAREKAKQEAEADRERRQVELQEYQDAIWNVLKGIAAVKEIVVPGIDGAKKDGLNDDKKDGNENSSSKKKNKKKKSQKPRDGGR